MSGVTSGLTVIELGEGIAPAYCTKLLADYGADVIKVERPEGDRLRAAGPFRDDRPSADGGGLFGFLNTSKQSVSIDWPTPEGRHLVVQLLERADLVVHSLPGPDRAALGLGAPEREDAGLVEVAVTPFGLDGPYADHESESITLAALSGWMFCMGDEDKPPLYPGGPYIEFLSGVSAASAALIALEAKERIGAGQVVDVSEYEVAVEALVFDPLLYSYSGRYRGRTGDLFGGSPTVAILPCADGFVQFHEGPRVRELLRFIGGDELADDDRFATNESRLAHRDDLRAALLDGVADRSRWDLFEQGGRAHLVISAVPDMADLLRLTPHLERGYFHRVTDGPLAGITVPGPPIRFGEGEWRCDPAPALGPPFEPIAAGPDGGRS